MISFICFLVGLLSFSHFSVLTILVFSLITLYLYRVCYYFNFQKLQTYSSYLYGGLSTGLILRLGIYCWLSQNYVLLIIILPIIGVLLIVVYEELFKKHYSLSLIAFGESEELCTKKPEIKNDCAKVYLQLKDKKPNPSSFYTFSPKEAYLLEQFSALHFFEILRNNHRQFLDGLEELFEIYMHNLPYNLRDFPLPERADINWGGTVLPNFRSTMDRIEYAYIKIKSGDFTYLNCVGEIRSNDKGLSEFSPHWMDDLPNDKVRQCWDYYSITNRFASIIRNSYPKNWDMGFLEAEFPEAAIFQGIDVDLPSSYPIYRINFEITVKSNEKVKTTGIYICKEDQKRIEFIASSKEEDRGWGSVVPIGVDPDTYETLYAEVNWILIERIADEGGSDNSLDVENIKALSSQSCPRSGYWWSPAKKSQSRYFEQGEIFPKIENSDWGETIWYLEITNKLQ